MDALTRWYFAYGSNMQSDTLRRRRGIAPTTTLTARLPSYRLLFDIPVGPGLRGVANIAPQRDSEIWGVLYGITPEQHEHLGRTEGVPAGLYRWLSVEVETLRGPMAAETLISDRRESARLPSLRYRQILVDGAREHGLDAAWVAALENLELAWDERVGAINPPGARRR